MEYILNTGVIKNSISEVRDPLVTVSVITNTISFKRNINVPVYTAQPREILLRTLAGQIIPKPES